MAGEVDKGQAEAPASDSVSEDRIEAKIDRDLRDSFPASDPPGWVLGVSRKPAEKEGEDSGGAPPPPRVTPVGNESRRVTRERLSYRLGLEALNIRSGRG